MKLIAPVLILAAGLLLSVKTSPAKPDYTRRTGKDCEFCHPPDSRKLNQAGEYYRDHRNSLKGYQPPPEPSKEKTAGKTHAFDSQVEIMTACGCAHA